MRRQIRVRDFLALGALFAALLVILMISGALRFTDALTSFFVFGFGAGAFYLATSSIGRDPEPESHDENDQKLALHGRKSDTVRAATLINAYPDPALLVRENGTVIAANGSASDIFRLPRRSGGLAAPMLRRPDVLLALKEVERLGLPQMLEIEVSGDPDEFYRARLSPLKIEDESFVLISLQELTELRRAEKARADFLANASHELRTPLTSLSGFIETMRGPARDDPESWGRFLDIMYAQTERMRRLIHDLLSLSRIELNEHMRPDAIVDLAVVVHETADAITPIARQRNVSLVVDAPDAPVLVRGQRDELLQVAQNLIDNAVKYSEPDTTVRIALRADLEESLAQAFATRRLDNAARITIVRGRIDPEARYACLRVEDGGRGIERIHLPRLGERFYRIEESRDRLVGGTGLGLAIVKHIMSRHRGSFAVESAPGIGSAFSIWLTQINGPDELANLNTTPL